MVTRPLGASKRVAYNHVIGHVLDKVQLEVLCKGGHALVAGVPSPCVLKAHPQRTLGILLKIEHHHDSIIEPDLLLLIAERGLPMNSKTMNEQRGGGRTPLGCWDRSVHIKMPGA